VSKIRISGSAIGALHASRHSDAGVDSVDHDALTNYVANEHISASGRSATLVVASNDASDLRKAQADYLCDGIADDVQIQAALDVLKASAAGGVVLCTEGTFTLAAVIEVGGAIGTDEYVTLEGMGPRVTTFKTTTDIEGIRMKYTSGVGEHVRLGGRGFSITHTGSSTKAGLFIRDVRWGKIENVKINGFLYNFFGHGTFGKVHFDSCASVNPAANGFGYLIAAGRKAGGTEPVTQPLFTNCNHEQNNNTASALKFGITGTEDYDGANDFEKEDEIDEFTWIGGRMSGNGGNGTCIVPVNGLFTSKIQGCLLNNWEKIVDMVDFDQSDVANNAHFFLEFDNVRFGQDTGTLFALKGNRTRVKLINPDFNNATQAGGFLFECIADAPEFAVEGGMTGASLSGTFTFFLVTAGNPTISLKGARIDIGGSAAAVGTVTAATVYCDHEDDTNEVAPRLIGKARGTGTITSGGTTDVITHGLDFTPTAEQIQIVLTENPTNTPGAIWVDTITSTQFTVNCENDPGASNLDFRWLAAVL